jgi:hypothetical protein
MAKATPKTKVTSNMPPEGGTTYEYANPNYGGPYEPFDGHYTGPDAIERAIAERTAAGMEWRIADMDSGYPRWMWLPKNEGE